jgi:hypothetical protein
MQGMFINTSAMYFANWDILWNKIFFYMQVLFH